MDITNTKRSKSGKSWTHLNGAFWSRSRLLSLPGEWGQDGWDGAGEVNLIAFLITLRRLHDTASSLKTSLSSAHDSNAAKKHFSALSSSPVKSSANRYK